MVGDAVSPAEWNDLWLNESFATYGQWMWLDSAGLSTLESDAEFALSTRNAIGGEPTGEPTVGNLFGFERYDGGAVVLHALRRQIGDEAFFALLAAVGGGQRRGQRSTDEFIALAEDVSGQALSRLLRRVAVRHRRARPVPLVTGAGASARRASPHASPPRRPPGGRRRSDRSARSARPAAILAVLRPSHRHGSAPERRVVPDPRQLAEVALLAGHQLGQGASGQVDVATPSPA